MLLIALLIAFTFPIAFLVILNRFDLYNTGKFHFNLLTLAGGVVAYYVAAHINPWVVNMGWAPWSTVVRFVAPVVEEILKSLILIYLVQRADFNYVVDGALYGFGAGIGFAVIENYEYVTGNAQIALVLALVRVFSTNLMHATGSGLIGTALAYSRGDKNKRQGFFIILGGFAVAMLFHGLFNTMVNAGAFLVLAIAYGVIGLWLIWTIIRRGMNIQKDWVAEKLGMADRVTLEETKVVSNIETVNEVLRPVEQRFGTEKAGLVRNLIYKQAEIGIKRKLLESVTSDVRKAEMETIIKELVAEVDDLRKNIGAYCMMMVREVYLGQDLQMWNLLNARVAAAGLGQKGGGLWDRVATRVKQNPDEAEKP